MVKYVVIDLSKLDGDKLGEMLTEAYQQGYKDAQKASNISIGYETSPWNTISGISVGDSITNTVEITSCSNTAVSANNCNSADRAISYAVSKAKKNTHNVE